MIAALSIAISLQLAPVEDLAREGERLGRLSTLFALCEPYYGVDIEAGRRLADDFEQRSSEAGWTSRERTGAYDRGRVIERAELGVVMDASGATPQEARRYLSQMLPRLKRRCQDLARDVPGAITDVSAGDRRLDAEIRRWR